MSDFAAGILGLTVAVFFRWLLYRWARHIAVGRGRSPSNGWWGAILGLWGVLIVWVIFQKRESPDFVAGG
jgi:hypothetical protein